MSESGAVLFHSYSFAAPLPHNESHEDSPIHALSQSVSFGRFMTENLEWGKWSSFSHKKYVDEAEKFSQPGSVAQKKAFFEAHYKKIADAKKAKASNESSSSSPSQLHQQEQPESVAVLLNTLETLTKDEVKDDESNETEKDDVPERNSAVVVLEQIEEDSVVDKTAVADGSEKSVVGLEQEDDTIAHDEMEVEEDHTNDGKLLNSVGEKIEEEEERRSVTKNSSLLISSMEKSAATPEAVDKAKELAFSQNISERPVTHSSMKKDKSPVRQRFGFLKCLMGNTKTQDQNTTRKKRKTDKKPNKPFLCLCFKPEMVRDTETPMRKQRKNL